MIKVGGYKKIIKTLALVIVLAGFLLPTNLFAFGNIGSTAKPEDERRAMDISAAQPLINSTVTNLNSGLEERLNDALARLAKETNPAQRELIQKNIDDLRKKIADQEALRRDVASNVDQSAKEIGAPEETYCSFNIFGYGFSVWKCLLFVLAAFLNIISFALISVVMTASGWMLDLSIYFSVVNMKAILGADGVVFVWSIARDLANMSLIFVLLYTAATIIIKGASSGNAKKLITNVIIVALLVNFSGFFVRAATDVSNVLAYEFYKAIVPKNDVAQSMIGSVSWGFIAKSQAAKFFTARSQSNQTAKIDAVESSVETQTKNLSLAKIFGDFIFDLLFGVVAFFVFIYLAILFIIRIITITAVFMFSPILVLAYAVPGIKGVANKWQKNLINQLIFAPVMMFFLYATVMMMKKGIGFDPNASTGFGVLFGNSLNSAIYYIIVMGILIKSVGWAKGIADSSGGYASQATGAIVGGLGAAGGYAMGKFGKTSAGQNLSNRAQNWYNSERFGAGAARAFGRSGAGQAVGEFAKKPLSTTASRFKLDFVDKSSAEKWGNMMDTSSKAKEKQTEDRVFGSGDNKFNDEKVLMNFLGMNAKDQAHAYSKMNDKQRGLVDHVLTTGNTATREKIIDGMLSSEKLDDAFINTITDPKAKIEAQNKAVKMKAKVTEDLNKMLGTTTPDEEAATAAEAAATADPTNTALGVAATAARTKATASALNNPIPEITANIAKLKTSLSGKEKGEVTKARRTVENKATSSIGKNVAKELIKNTTLSVDATTWDPIKHPTTPLERVAAIRSINPEDIVNLFEDDPAKFVATDNMVKFLTGKQLKALSDSSTITKTQGSELIAKLEAYQRDLPDKADRELDQTIRFADRNQALF